MNGTGMKLHWKVAIALFLALPTGWLLSEQPSLWGVPWLNILTLLGQLFLNALKMLIVPLIVSSIITGIAGIGSGQALGRLGSKTIGYYLLTSLLAILTGLLLVNLLHPGVVDGQGVANKLGLTADSSAVATKVTAHSTSELVSVFYQLIPTNIISAAAQGQMLGLIVFSLIFGYFMTRIGEPYAESQYSFWQGLYETMLKITDWVIGFAPFGIFALVSKTVATTGVQAFYPLLWFVVTVMTALLIHFLVTLPVLLRLSGVNPLRHYRAMAPAMLMAFSTASSSATLPLTMECVTQNAKVSQRVSSFVLPLGATVNMDGTALYECVAAMFIAQAYGVELSFATQFVIVFVALVTSIGVAGIPSASLVAISIILTTVGLPLEGIGIILAVDRLLDMARTTVNVFSDTCGAVVIGRMEGEERILQNES